MSTVESDGAAFDHFIDRVIRRLDTYGHLDGFSDEDLIRILERAQKLLEPQPALIEVRAPVTVFGDLHGQFADLKRFLELVGRPPQTRMLFLGDYVDRCKSSMEVTVLLLCFKIKHPNDIQLLRGNHECAKMNRNYGFYEEVRRKRSVAIWKRFQAVFSELPLCASINRRIFCCHGGISPEIKSWDSLTKLAKPRLNIDCDVGIPLDLMWADPSQDTCAVGWQYNKIRNASWMFGADTIRDFCRLLDIDLIVRAHEATKDGHQFHGDKNQLCTIFSAPNYCGIDGNCASVLRVSEKLEISFLSLRPRLDLTQMTAERRAELHRQAQAMEVKSPLPGGGPHHQTPHFTIQPPIYEQPEPPIISTIAPVDQKTSAQQPSILKVTTPPMSPSSSLTSYTPSTKTD